MDVQTSTLAAIRYGYGFHPGERAPAGPDELMAMARAGATTAPLFPADPMARRVEKLRAFGQARKRNAGSSEVKAIRKTLRNYARGDAARRVFQRALSPYGFFERLCAFWADHFTIAARNLGHRVVTPMFELDAIRPHVMGSFADMLVASTRHPVMLHYLDQVQSFGPNSRAGQRRGRGLNENLAREILELHTLGVGAGYTQRDVREFAELLTGYATHQGYADFRFRPERAEPGAETVLGQSYGPGAPSADHAEALLRDLSRHEATAHHIAYKLVVHFVSDAPEEDHVRHVTGAFRRHDGALPRVYEALLEHPAAWRQFGVKVKQPLDLVVSTIRAIGMTRAQIARRGDKAGAGALLALREMNQPMFAPPGPNGWPEEVGAWITPQGLAARISYAGKVGHLLARRADLDPRRFAETALRDALRGETAFVVGGAPDRWEGFALVLASPEFNRR